MNGITLIGLLITAFAAGGWLAGRRRDRELERGWAEFDQLGRALNKREREVEQREHAVEERERRAEKLSRHYESLVALRTDDARRTN